MIDAVYITCGYTALPLLGPRGSSALKIKISLILTWKHELHFPVFETTI